MLWAFCSAAVALWRPADKLTLKLLWPGMGLPSQVRVTHVLHIFSVNIGATGSVRPQTQVWSKNKKKQTNKQMGDYGAGSHNEEKNSLLWRFPQNVHSSFRSIFCSEQFVSATECTHEDSNGATLQNSCQCLLVRYGRVLWGAHDRADVLGRVGTVPLGAGCTCLTEKLLVENRALLGCYTARSGNYLPTFQDCMLLPSSGVSRWIMGPIGCPETSVKNYHY